MKLIEGINFSGKPFYIPDCSRMELPEFFKSLGFTIGAEVGVYKGKFCEKFCLAGIKMYAIDNWFNPLFQERQDYLYNYAKKVIAKTKNGTVIKKNSIDAVLDFKEESLDFVYIDADHSFKAANEDIHAWYKIIKKGGIVAGHDYSYTGSDKKALNMYNSSCQVKQAVDNFMAEFKIDKFWIFGRTKPIEEESKNDRYLSWMFFKP